MKISSIVEHLPSSGIRQIFDVVVAMEQRGEKVIRFDVGRPDIPTPSFVVEAAKQALDDGFTTYVANRGIPDLLSAISNKLHRQNHLTYNPETEIIVTAGASEAVAVAILGVLEPGSELLVPEPLWPHYVNCARMAGATVVPVPLDVRDGFRLSSELLSKYVTARTRMLVLNSPCNPTGATYAAEVLEDMRDFAFKHGLFVLADEIYEYFVYDDKPPSFAALPGARENTILVNGFSKAFGMTGWRLGYLAAPANLVAQLNKVHQYVMVCATSFAQKGAVQAYTDQHSDIFIRRTVASLKERRDALLEEIAGVDRMQYGSPAGAFYFFPALPHAAPDSAEAASILLQQSKIATVPGRVFGQAFDRHLRISYGSCSVKDVRTGIRGMIETFYK